MIRGCSTRCSGSILAAIALLALGAGSAFAQGTGTIRGTVTEGATGRALSGVHVALTGSNRGGLSSASGNFLILNVPAGTHTLRAELIGYAPVTREVSVDAGATAEVAFEMTVSAIDMDGIVVTGTPGAASKRTLGNSITQIDASDMMEQTAVTTLTELLQSKTPGLQILTNSGNPGAASDMRIRGASSLLGNRPVIYVDGVRFSDANLGTFTPSGAGTTSYSGQTTSAIDFLNPNDIESIEVIKGPAAATLYGAEAAGGVIQVITKKGMRGEQAMRWDIRSEIGENEWALDIPTNYTTCTAALIAEVDASGEPVWPGCQGQSVGTVLTDNPMRRDPKAMRVGSVERLALSARGGGERYSFYFAADLNNEDGVFVNSYNDRRSLRANFTIQPQDWIDLQVNTAYARGELRLPVGDEAFQGMLLSAYRGKPGRVTTNPDNEGWFSSRPDQANAYNNTTDSDRLTLGTTVNVNPLPWLRNRLTLGMDFTSSLAQILSPPGSADADYAGVPQGVVAQRLPRNYVYTVDYVGNVDVALTDQIQSTTSFGVQANARKYESLYASGTGFGAPDVVLIGTAQATDGSNSFVENRSLGFFLQQQIGWQNRLFLTGALRADDNSSFGDSFDWIYYPKASLAWVLSEEPALMGIFDMLRVDDFKLRTAYGQAGRAPDPFTATQTYTVTQYTRPDGTIGSALIANSFGNPDLAAERGEEIEVGFDASMLQDRVGMELTYYHKTMTDLIIPMSPPGSSGFAGAFFGFTGSVYENLGETKNSGFELGLTAVPLQRRNVSWNSRISLATNSNELVSFGDGRTDMAVASQSYGTMQRHRPGYPLAGYWFNKPLRDANGNLELNASGVPLTEDTLSYIGPSAPTREVSFANTLTVMRDFSLFVLFDYKGGHYLYNYNEYNRCRFQNNCAAMNDASLVDHPDRPLWQYSPYYYVQDASFVKLRDVSLTYNLPTTWAQKFRANAASLTLAGHNLALWTDYGGVDPEMNSYGNRSFARAEIYAVPMLRRMSVSMNLSF